MNMLAWACSQMCLTEPKAKSVSGTGFTSLLSRSSWVLWTAQMSPAWASKQCLQRLCRWMIFPPFPNDKSKHHGGYHQIYWLVIIPFSLVVLSVLPGHPFILGDTQIGCASISQNCWYQQNKNTTVKCSPGILIACCATFHFSYSTSYCSKIQHSWDIPTPPSISLHPRWTFGGVGGGSGSGVETLGWEGCPVCIALFAPQKRTSRRP